MSLFFRALAGRFNSVQLAHSSSLLVFLCVLGRIGECAAAAGGAPHVVWLPPRLAPATLAHTRKSSPLFVARYAFPSGVRGALSRAQLKHLAERPADRFAADRFAAAATSCAPHLIKGRNVERQLDAARTEKSSQC